MKRFFMAMLAIFGLMTAATLPAEANWDWSAPVSTQAAAAPQNWDWGAANWDWGKQAPQAQQTHLLMPAPPSFWYKISLYYANQVPPVCLADGIGNPSGWPVAQVATAWNNNLWGPTISVRNRCDEYSPGLRATIDTYSALDSNCFRLLGGEHNNYQLYQGWRVWNNNPVVQVQVNTAYNCNSTGFRRLHWLSSAIGTWLGLAELNTSSWANRVMCTCSQDTVSLPSSADLSTVNLIYSGDYHGGYTS